MKRRLWTILGLALPFVVLPGLALIWMLFSSNVVGGESQEYTLKIKRGMTFNAIVAQMTDDGLIDSARKLQVAATVFGYKDRIKAGKYEIKGGISSYALLQKLVAGKVADERITIPEGTQSRQIAALLEKRIETDSARFMSLVQDQEFVRKLDVEAPALEGFLFPNTYSFHWGMSEEEVIRTMVREFNRQFDDSLRAAAQRSPFSILELITFASIIEGETVLDSEREIVSAVYHNRLRRGMLLQADPTIQYIIADGPRRLLNRDLKIDSPYNTYKYTGLPPGPINNPGLASIRASLNPADVDYLYFVANGDGSHTFSRTLREHLKAKARFDAHRRQIKAKQNSDGDG